MCGKRGPIGEAIIFLHMQSDGHWNKVEYLPRLVEGRTIESACARNWRRHPYILSNVSDDEDDQIRVIRVLAAAYCPQLSIRFSSLIGTQITPHCIFSTR